MAAKDFVIYILLILLGWLSYLILEPFLPYAILALLFAFLFHPLYTFFRKFMWGGIAAIVVLIIILLVIVIPSVYLGGQLVQQATDAYQVVHAAGITAFDEATIADVIEGWTGLDVKDQIVTLFDQGSEFLKGAIPDLIRGTGFFLVGLFVFFVVLFFALREGPVWFDGFIRALPVTPQHRKQISRQLMLQSRALLYGQILTSVVAGVLIGLLYWWFGIPNPLFWAVVTMIMAVIPVVGAFMVYIPAGIYLIFQGSWISGIMLMIAGVAIQQFLDNILRPKFVSDASQIHPAFVILGALGGIVLMGVVGFLVGPLVLSFFVTLVQIESGKK